MAGLEEFEEGELPHSDEDSPAKTQTSPVKPAQVIGKLMYRSSHQNRSAEFSDTSSHSEAELSNDDDECDFEKKPKRWDGHMDISDDKFVNPLLNKKLKKPLCEDMQRKKKTYNIWADVQLENSLTGVIKEVSVEQFDYNIDRGVESYKFSNAVDDPRCLKESTCTPCDDSMFSEDRESGKDENFLDDGEESICMQEKFGDKFRNTQLDKLADNRNGKHLKRSRDIHSRLGKAKRKVSFIQVTTDNSREEIVKALAENLSEPKVELLERVVDNIGAGKSIELMNATNDIEHSGGMLTLNGSRRRTMGGIFLHLLKSDKGVTHGQIKEIFREEERIKKKFRRNKMIDAKVKDLKKQIEKEEAAGSDMDDLEYGGELPEVSLE